MRIAVENGDPLIVDMCRDRGHSCVKASGTASPPDLVILAGGYDVTPSIYGQPKSLFTKNNPVVDMRTDDYVNYAIENDVPVVGICRGGQFLHIKNGGCLWQHVDRHTENHEVEYEGKRYVVTSTHHQMMRSPPEGARVLVVANQGGARVGSDGFINDLRWVHYPDGEIEVVYYDDKMPVKGVAFQPHPEYDSDRTGTRDLFVRVIEDCLGLKF